MERNLKLTNLHPCAKRIYKHDVGFLEKKFVQISLERNENHFFLVKKT